GGILTRASSSASQLIALAIRSALLAPWTCVKLFPAISALPRTTRRVILPVFPPAVLPVGAGPERSLVTATPIVTGPGRAFESSAGVAFRFVSAQLCLLLFISGVTVTPAGAGVIGVTERTAG